MANSASHALIDSHCHLDFADFEQDRLSVLSQCYQQGVEAIIVPGTRRKQWQQQLMIVQQFPSLYAGIGLHPYFLNEYQPSDLDVLVELLKHKPNDVVALGEIGIDGHISTPLYLQKQIFEAQLQLAKEYGLPIVVHHRRSHHDIMPLLKQNQLPSGGVIHAFSGSQQQAFQYLDLGFKLGFGGIITYERAQKTRKSLAALPDDGYVLETDSPDMPISGFQGKRNSPALLPLIAEHVARIRQQSISEICEQSRRNTITLFGLPLDSN